MIDDHGLTVSGKSGGRGIDRPTQGCHANLYQRLLDVPIVGRLHAPEYIKLNVQRVLVQVLAQISGQCAFARAARTVEYDDAPRGAQRFSNRHLGTCRRPANAGRQSIVVQVTHGVERPFVAGCRPTRSTVADPDPPFNFLNNGRSRAPAQGSSSPFGSARRGKIDGGMRFRSHAQWSSEIAVSLLGVFAGRFKPAVRFLQK